MRCALKESSVVSAGGADRKLGAEIYEAGKRARRYEESTSMHVDRDTP